MLLYLPLLLTHLTERLRHQVLVSTPVLSSSDSPDSAAAVINGHEARGQHLDLGRKVALIPRSLLEHA